MHTNGENPDSRSQAGKAQEIGDFLNAVVIIAWKNQVFSDTTREVSLAGMVRKIGYILKLFRFAGWRKQEFGDSTRGDTTWENPGNR